MDLKNIDLIKIIKYRFDLKYIYIASIKLKFKMQCTEGLGLAVGGACLLPLLLGSSPYLHACHPRGALHAHWVCRVFSGPWD